MLLLIVFYSDFDCPAGPLGGNFHKNFVNFYFSFVHTTGPLSEHFITILSIFCPAEPLGKKFHNSFTNFYFVFCMEIPAQRASHSNLVNVSN